jgi:hypothetical protein
MEDEFRISRRKLFLYENSMEKRIPGINNINKKRYSFFNCFPFQTREAEPFPDQPYRLQVMDISLDIEARKINKYRAILN